MEYSFKKTKIFVLLAILILLFLFIRVWTLLFCPTTFHEGELYRGTIAKEILEGRSWSPLLYQNDAHEGGSLIIGIIISVFFYLFGQSIIVLKSVSFLAAFLSFLLILRFMYKYYDFNASLFTGLIISLAPPIFLIYSVITMGKYYELIVLEFITILLFFRIFFKTGSGGSVVFKQAIDTKDYYRVALLGFLNGLGLYFSYAYLILLSTFIIIWIILDRKLLTKKYFFIHMIFFVIGFSPWIIYNFNQGFKGLFIHQRHILQYFGFSLSRTRLDELGFDYIPGAFAMSVKPVIFGYIYYTVTIAAVMFTAYFVFNRIMNQNVKKYETGKIFFYPDSFLLVYIGFYVLFYCLSDFRSSVFEDNTRYKYLFCLLPFIFMAIGSFLGKVCSLKNNFSYILVPLLTVILILPCLFFMCDISLNNFNTYLITYKPYSYELMGANVVKFESNPLRRLGFLNQIKKKYRGYTYKGLGSMLAEEFMANPDWYFNRFFNRIDKDYRKFFYTGLGVGLAYRHREDALIIQLIADKIQPDGKPYCYLGIGIVRAMNREQVVSLIEKLDRDYLPYFYEGVGIGMMEYSEYDPNKARRFALEIKEKYRPFCYKGIEEFACFKEYRSSCYD